MCDKPWNKQQKWRVKPYKMGYHGDTRGIQWALRWFENLDEFRIVSAQKLVHSRNVPGWWSNFTAKSRVPGRSQASLCADLRLKLPGARSHALPSPCRMPWSQKHPNRPNPFSHRSAWIGAYSTISILVASSNKTAGLWETNGCRFSRTPEIVLTTWPLETPNLLMIWSRPHHNAWLPPVVGMEPGKVQWRTWSSPRFHIRNKRKWPVAFYDLFVDASLALKAEVVGFK